MPTLEFKGKSFVYTHHLSVPFRELVIDPKKSLPAAGAKPSLDDNLIIHGDNLHALKALLPIYAGKVDCIVIDPPYNTGNEGWCYNDNVRSPLMREWLKKASPVDKEDLERHDKWLCMMWPRLKLLHELLAEDGAIFICIDDNEVHRVMGTMDEIFGEQNFVTTISWHKRISPANDALFFSTDHDHILVYAKKSKSWKPNRTAREGDQLDYYSNPDDDPRGPWNSAAYTCAKTAEERPNLYYPLKNPNTGQQVWPSKTRVWAYEEATHKKNVQENLIWWGKDGKARMPRLKKFLGGRDVVPRSVWSYQFAGHNQEAKLELMRVFPDRDFDTPKPVRLIERILQIGTHKDALILDSFAGSGTTSHAVLALNKKDGGNRKFILVECEDYADKLTAERVRRVIKGYKFEGTQRTELLREPITFTALKKADKLLEKVQSIEFLEGKKYDRIAKTVEDGALVVVGEKKVTEKAEGLGGSFTFVTLGEEMGLDKLLAGEKPPSFEALAKYVFYTATGRTLTDVPKQKAEGDGFIGETDLYRVHLHYRPDREWLRTNDAALSEKLVERMVAANKGKKRVLAFAAAKFMSQRELTRLGVEFCQLPYTIHRIMGD